MSSKYTNTKPTVPYGMNHSSYIGGYNGYGGRYGGYGPYGNRGFAIPDKNTVQDFKDSRVMAGRRNKDWNPFYFRWETKLTDVATATVERDKDGRPIRKLVHTPTILTEQYYSQLEYFFRVARIKFLSFLIIAALLVALIVVIVINL